MKRFCGVGEKLPKLSSVLCLALYSQRNQLNWYEVLFKTKCQQIKSAEFQDD